jgi:surface antigen
LLAAQPAATAANASSSQNSQQQVACSCVLYVRSRVPSLPGLAYARDYTEARMRSFGYKKVNPTAGAILVWDANQKGAGGLGHIAIVRSARYDTRTKKWIIVVDQANWGTACSISTTQFTWGDLYGVNAYVR